MTRFFLVKDGERRQVKPHRQVNVERSRSLSDVVRPGYEPLLECVDTEGRVARQTRDRYFTFHDKADGLDVWELIEEED